MVEEAGNHRDGRALTMVSTPQGRAPLYEALLGYIREGVLPCHFPGHKQGRGVDPRFLEFVGHGAFYLDLTEVPGLDDLHRPAGAIAEAQRLAAEAFGAEETFFLVNGTTAGNQAMLLATCRPGDLVAVARNAHRSVLAGLIMSGAFPLYLEPEWDPRLGIWLGLDPGKVEAVLERNPGIRALLLTYPTYHGIAGHLEPILRQAHERGIPVLVDEAHGSHLGFHPCFPPSAMQAGADASAQSAHKTLGALTQASYLHVRGRRVDRERLRSALQMVQTTSPSYLLMVSLDLARRRMALEGYSLLGRALELAREARRRLNRIPGLYCPGEEMTSRPGVAGLDPSRLLIHLAELGITARQAESWLREHCRIQVEGAEGHLLVVPVTIADTPDTLEALVAALGRMAREKAGPAGEYPQDVPVPRPPAPEVVLSPREALFRPRRRLPLRSATGHLAAEWVCPYPPGVPVLAPGERLTPEVVGWLEYARAAGLKVQGPADSGLHTIAVLS